MAILYVFYFYIIGCYSVFRKQKEFLKHNKTNLYTYLSPEKSPKRRGYTGRKTVSYWGGFLHA